jgi:hypothetical protein
MHRDDSMPWRESRNSESGRGTYFFDQLAMSRVPLPAWQQSDWFLLQDQELSFVLETSEKTADYQQRQLAWHEVCFDPQTNNWPRIAPASSEPPCYP